MTKIKFPYLKCVFVSSGGLCFLVLLLFLRSRCIYSIWRHLTKVFGSGFLLTIFIFPYKVLLTVIIISKNHTNLAWAACDLTCSCEPKKSSCFFMCVSTLKNICYKNSSNEDLKLLFVYLDYIWRIETLIIFKVF